MKWMCEGFVTNVQTQEANEQLRLSITTVNKDRPLWSKQRNLQALREGVIAFVPSELECVPSDQPQAPVTPAWLTIGGGEQWWARGQMTRGTDESNGETSSLGMQSET